MFFTFIAVSNNRGNIGNKNSHGIKLQTACIKLYDKNWKNIDDAEFIEETKTYATVRKLRR